MIENEDADETAPPVAPPPEEEPEQIWPTLTQSQYMLQCEKAKEEKNSHEMSAHVPQQSSGKEESLGRPSLETPRRSEDKPRFSLEMIGRPSLERFIGGIKKKGAKLKKRKNSYVLLAIGFVCAELGMILFNFGIYYGLSQLGDRVGALLPGT